MCGLVTSLSRFYAYYVVAGQLNPRVEREFTKLCVSDHKSVTLESPQHCPSRCLERRIPGSTDRHWSSVIFFIHRSKTTDHTTLLIYPLGFFCLSWSQLMQFFYHCYVHINKHWVPKKFCTACIDWQYWNIFVFGKQYDLMLTSWVRFLWNWETTENVNNLHKDNDQDVRSYWRLFKTLKFVFYNYKIKRSFFLVEFEVKFVSILTTHEVGNIKIMIEISNHT